MEGGKWEDLSMDCLVNVFGRVGIESLLLDVPFMCKSWYKATLNPLCWRRLDFSKISLDSWSYDESISRLLDKYQLNDKLSVTAFIKFVVKRSARSATFLSLPDCCTEEALLYVADECPDLRVLLLPRCLPRDHMLQIPNLMSKWKNLELLRLGGTFHLQEILAQINIHCKNFIGLGIPRAYIKRDEASAIVTLLPNIKQLFLRHASMEKENLVMILQGCKELKYFDVRDCIGFDEGDDEILKLASHIQTFEHKGSMLYDYYDDYRPSYRDDGFHDGGMEGEKRKELNMDCLVNVLGRVEIESLLIDVPFVCKSWYKATRSPLCWRKLDFLEISLDDCTSLFFLARLIDDYQVKGKFSFTAIVKTLVKHSDYIHCV
ncbi:hypothetical protein TEA_019986 [Camellia sinensis var. sinensis]|uniref:F-box domain-containing protein n=1 Tax=Camellia sinensis var. sinensis TaxID=542762 RepID=A0A4S4DSZ2_CAMSN|nr:hypothetical protein TEA_019986 [Camellia sinensis var. sinensis]